MDADTGYLRKAGGGFDALNWRKASYSASNGGAWVEVGTADRVLVRDTQDRTGSVLRFSPGAWRRFASQVKRS